MQDYAPDVEDGVANGWLDNVMVHIKEDPMDGTWGDRP